MKESIRMSQHIQPKEVLSPIIGDLYMLSHCRPANRNSEIQTGSILVNEMSQPWESKPGFVYNKRTYALCLISSNVLTCVTERSWRQQTLWNKQN